MSYAESHHAGFIKEVVVRNDMPPPLPLFKREMSPSKREIPSLKHEIPPSVKDEIAPSLKDGIAPPNVEAGSVTVSEASNECSPSKREILPSSKAVEEEKKDEFCAEMLPPKMRTKSTQNGRAKCPHESPVKALVYSDSVSEFDARTPDKLLTKRRVHVKDGLPETAEKT